MISVFGCDVGNLEKEYVSAVLESNWLGLGSTVADFEHKFSEVMRVPNFRMVDSGSNALYLAVKLLNLPPGSKIIVPSYTWVACAQAVILAGHQPIFCDVDYHTENVTPELIEPIFTKEIRAIMLVHYAGLPINVREFRQFDVPIVEDCAHAVDSWLDGEHVGSAGDVAIFSFDAVKNLTAAEAGGIAVQNPDLVKKIDGLRYCGIAKSGFQGATGNSAERWWEYAIEDVFPKMLPNNVSAAIGLAQLERLPVLQERRKDIWNFYGDVLSNIDELELPISPMGNQGHSYFCYSIKVERRDELARHLLSRGIYTTLRYHPLHLNQIYRTGDLSDRLSNCEHLNESALCIPLHPRLSDEDTHKVVDSIIEFYRS